MMAAWSSEVLGDGENLSDVRVGYKVKSKELVNRLKKGCEGTGECYA